jgi:hydroxymethylpyrimidine kinase/phosphomethylpyrimidine kinase/thiamine-phosphate diphosphorylase
MNETLLSNVVWCVAGNDSGGGAGLSADLRAADAFGVHACPVVAAVTAQHSHAVRRVDAMDPALLAAQLDTLADDLRPRVIKTGVLGSAANVRVLAHCIDRLRAEGPLALVVDPVLRASSGDALADRELLATLRGELLPRATLLTPNRREAATLLGRADAPTESLPELARAFQALGSEAVCITGGDAEADGCAHDWLQTPHAQGWLSGPRFATRHSHGTGCSFASAAAAALARGFVAADALVLARMALAGQGPGPVRLQSGFAAQARALPMLWPEDRPPADATVPSCPARRPGTVPAAYAIVDSAARAEAVLAAGVKTVQLRIKSAEPDAHLRDEITRSLRVARQAGARLVVNDHWTLALELGATAVHLGQEDLQALDGPSRRQLREAQARGLQLSLSSHSLWELARAAAWSPAAVACGPVWPTTTKAMPWRPQGLHNLAWWCAVAPAPVIAIGGILSPAQAADAARCGPAAVALVRALNDDPAGAMPAYAAALAQGAASAAVPVPALPQPSLSSGPAGASEGLSDGRTGALPHRV